jgi:MFS transporter, putative metabolite:H+ symporter
LNRFHMWFPGGIVVGSLLSFLLTHAHNHTLVALDGNIIQNIISRIANIIISALSAIDTHISLGWQAQIWLIVVPTLTYAYLFWGQTFPKPKTEGVTSIGENIKAMFTPLYIFMFCCMALTAISEFGPQQWTGLIMSKSGASPMIILALVTGLMAVIRYFAGPIVEKFDQTGVLLGSAIFATIGILLFATQTGSMVYVAAVFFAMGVALFWPNAEKVPLSGALGMSIIGGVGMFSTAIFQPIIGSWIDSERATKTAEGLTGDAMELAAGQATLDNIAIFPAILIVAFTVLFFWMRNRKTA